MSDDACIDRLVYIYIYIRERETDRQVDRERLERRLIYRDIN